MMTKTNCKRARVQIALQVGQDLDELEERQLRRHVAVCPDCREHQQRLKVDYAVLQECGGDGDCGPPRSVWPAVSERIVMLQRESALQYRFNGWVPAAVVTAASLLMFVFTGSPSTRQWDEGEDNVAVQSLIPIPAQPVAEPGPWRASPYAAPRGRDIRQFQAGFPQGGPSFVLPEEWVPLRPLDSRQRPGR